MKEQYHYKGDFLFNFSRTNQIKLAKSYISYLFPKEIIKLAKTKTLDSYSDELIQGLGSEAITALLDFRFPLLRTKIEEQSEKNPDNSVLLYLLINEVLETISGDEYINVQYYLA